MAKPIRIIPAVSNSISFQEPTYLLVSTKTRSSGIQSGQTTGHLREHARDLRTSGHFPSSSHKIPWSTSATRAISVLSSIILPLQTFFSRVLLLRQQQSAPRETNDNYRDKNRSLHVSLRTRKFDKKIHYCCRDSFFVEKDI